MPPPPPPLSRREVLEKYPTRETRIGRLKEIERALERMEHEDEENDPILIDGHIRLTRGYRMGCGVFVLCLAAMSWRVWHDGRGWAAVPMWVFAIVGGVMILRGVLYRPDPKLIQASYVPHRGSAGYRELVDQMDWLARAISQDLRAEDEGGGSETRIRPDSSKPSSRSTG